MKQMKSVLARVLVAAMVFGMMPATQGAQTEAAAKVKLSTKKLTITKGKTKKLSVKNAKKYKVSWKVKSKKTATFKKSGKYTVKVTGKKAGKTTITCTLKKGKKKKVLTCKIVVENKKSVGPTQTPKITPANTPTATPMVTPTATPVPDVPPMKEVFKGVFDNVGTCLTYNQTWGIDPEQMQNSNTMAFVDKHFNSFTLENEMKPENMMKKENTPDGTSKALLFTLDEAKKAGYVLSDDYKETTVPQLNLESIAEVLKIAKEHNIRMRAHTLMWHQQTPEWFFKKGYQNEGEVVDEATMNARLEFFVRTMVRYVTDKEVELTGEAGSLVYAWDVVNEYIHRSNAPSATTWTSVYGDLGLQPTYVKAAFEYAYDELKKKNVQDKVTLFYNDYDTYFSVEDEIALINYINEGEEAKICGGMGMQSHVDIRRPTLEEYGAALDAFLATGLEVQITELDITINFDTDDTDGREPSFDYKKEGETNEDQAAFTKDFIKLIVKKQKNRDKTVSPKGITGLTVWGISDSTSWRKQCKPLFFNKKRVKDPVTGKYVDGYVPKPSYTAMVEAVKGL